MVTQYFWTLLKSKTIENQRFFPFVMGAMAFSCVSLVVGPGKAFAEQRAVASIPNPQTAVLESDSSKAKSKKIPTVADLKPIERSGVDGSYMNNVAKPTESTQFIAEIYQGSFGQQLRERGAMNALYEDRAHYHLSGIADEVEWLERNRETAEWAFRKLINDHVEKGLVPKFEASLRQKAKEKSDGSGSQQAAQVIASVYAVHKALKGTNLNLGEFFQSKMRFDAPKGKLELALESVLFHADLQYRAYGVRKPRSENVGQTNIPDEKLSVGVYRKLLVDGASFFGRYALLGETLNLGLRHNLFGPVNAEVDQARHFRQGSSDEVIGRLSWGLNF